MRNIFFTALFFFLPIFIFSQEFKQPEFSGTWYPADPEQLNQLLSQLQEKIQVPKISDDIIGIIAPHAGYVYSAQIAAYSYKAAANKFYDTIVILSPSHKYNFDGIAVYSADGFATPLGNVLVDQQAAKVFTGLEFSQANTQYFQGEHDQEVQLPFIKTYFAEAKIVPILFGNMQYPQFEVIAEALVKLAKEKKVLVIVSTDLSHYHAYDQAVNIDLNTIDLITKTDSKQLWDTKEYNAGRACGIYPLIALIEYVKKRAASIEVLKYANSGDTAGNKIEVVGYLSAAAIIKGQKTQETLMKDFNLTDQEKKSLLVIARDSLENYVRYKKKIIPVALNQNLKQPVGAFVTLTENGQLRGCIGRIIADTALYQTVAQYAVYAGVKDDRFLPVQEKELKNIEIEISVLTPFTLVKDLNEIELGKHGAMLVLGDNSGLFLPQVALEQGWNKQTFFEQLCRKAELPVNAYKDPNAKLYRFSAIVFNEQEFKGK